MRSSFLLACLIASTSAFAPLANTVRSSSALAAQAVMESPVATPVRAGDKDKKKKVATPKATPAPKITVAPLKSSKPAKVASRPKAVFGFATVSMAEAPKKKSATKASPPKKQVAPPSKTSPMKGVPASKTTPRPKALFGM